MNIRNQEGPHDIMSPAVPQPVSNKNTKTTYATSIEAARPCKITEYRPAMASDKDLKIAEAVVQLQRAPLSVKGMYQFDAWKEDILRSVWSVHGRIFIGEEHWVIVNRLIPTHLHKEAHQTVASVIPEDYKDLGNMNPMELF